MLIKQGENMSLKKDYVEVLVKQHNDLCQQLGQLTLNKEQFLNHCDSELKKIEEAMRNVRSKIDDISKIVGVVAEIQNENKDEKSEAISTGDGTTNPKL